MKNCKFVASLGLFLMLPVLTWLTRKKMFATNEIAVEIPAFQNIIRGEMYAHKARKPPTKTSTRLIVWGVPRSVSTTFLISLSQSANVQGWFEPYYYASRTKLIGSPDDHMTPLNNTLRYKQEDTSYNWVKYQLEHTASNRSIVVKDMVKGIAGKFEFIPKGYNHTFLIRHPLRVFSAYKRKHRTSGLNLTDLPEGLIPPGYFFKEMYDLVQHVRDVLKLRVTILDSEDLLYSPGRMLKAFCRETGLGFHDKMLHWDPGAELWREWVLTTGSSHHWSKQYTLHGRISNHSSSFTNSGFGEPMDLLDLTDNVDPDVQKLTDASMEYYNELYKQRLVV